MKYLGKEFEKFLDESTIFRLKNADSSALFRKKETTKQDLKTRLCHNHFQRSSFLKELSIIH